MPGLYCGLRFFSVLWEFGLVAMVRIGNEDMIILHTSSYVKTYLIASDS